MQSYLTPQLDQHRSQIIRSSMLEQVSAQSLSASALPWAAFKLLMLSLLLVLALLHAWQEPSPPLVFLSCLCIAFILAQFAFLGHDAGHGTIHKRKSLNYLMGQVSMTIATGLTFGEWYARHRTHHQFCQLEEKDPDMDIDLVVSLTALSKQKKNSLGLWMTRYQHLHVWFLALFFAYSQRHLAQWGSLKQPLKYWKDLVFLMLHLSLWWLFPLYVLHVDGTRVAVVYFLPLLFLGPYLAAIFWVNHIGMPLIRNVENFSFLEHQAATSRTILNARWMDWFFGGLNFQIEHHLFPHVPSFRLKRVQAIVRREFAEQALPYNGMRFWKAVQVVAQHFWQLARD